MPVWGILIIVAACVAGAFVALHFYSKHVQKKHDEQQEQIDSYKQTYSMLVIDKKKMRLKDAGFPQVVLDNANFMARRAKVPVVKAKVGPRIMTLVADSKIFDQIPVKKEVRAVVSGIYIMEVRGIRGPLDVPEKKKGLWARAKDRAASLAGKSADDGKDSKRASSKKSGK